MNHLYFSINKDKNGSLCDLIFYSKTKTAAKNELRDRGFVPKLVLTWSDIADVKSGKFKNKDLTQELRDYVIFHEEQWKEKMEEMIKNQDENKE